MKLEPNVEYKTEDLFGYSPSVEIQYGMFDRSSGNITKVKFDSESNQYLFYWNFWDYGWYTADSINNNAKPLVKELLKKLNGDYLD